MARKTSYIRKWQEKKHTEYDVCYILTNRVLSNSFSILKIRTRKCKLMKACHVKLKKQILKCTTFWGVGVWQCPLQGKTNNEPQNF
jgi:hypothetical protein